MYRTSDGISLAVAKISNFRTKTLYLLILKKRKRDEKYWDVERHIRIGNKKIPRVEASG